MITQIIRKQFFCVTDVRVIGKLIPGQSMCNWRVRTKYPIKAPNYTKEFLPESPVQQMSCVIGKLIPRQ